MWYYSSTSDKGLFLCAKKSSCEGGKNYPKIKLEVPS